MNVLTGGKVADVAKSRASIRSLAIGTALWFTLAGCTGPLVYRPKKLADKPKPVPTDVKKIKSHLPPEPDVKANNATLAGIDTTGIGIRDDVHIWIYTNYTSTKKRTVLTEMAKALQAIIVKTPKTAEDGKKMEQALNDALLMLKGVPGLRSGEADEMGGSLYGKSVNTPQRSKAYLHYNLLLKGGNDTH
jgi:hypothetical protein